MTHAQEAPAARPKRESRALVLMLAGFALAVVLNGFFTIWTVSESQHRWCNTITTLDQADHAAPKPTSKFGRNLVTDFHRLRGQFGCGELCPASRTGRGSCSPSSPRASPWPCC
jgi:hypothetical protein